MCIRIVEAFGFFPFVVFFWDRKTLKQIIIFIELANGRKGAKGNGRNEKFNSRFQTFVCATAGFDSFDSRDLFCSQKPSYRALPFILFARYTNILLKIK